MFVFQDYEIIMTLWYVNVVILLVEVLFLFFMKESCLALKHCIMMQFYHAAIKSNILPELGFPGDILSAPQV